MLVLLLILFLGGAMPLAFGLAGMRSWRITLAGAALLIFAYLAVVTSFGIWAATCPNCNSGELHRSGDAVISAVVFAIYLAVALCVLGVGALLSWFMRQALLSRG